MSDTSSGLRVAEMSVKPTMSEKNLRATHVRALINKDSRQAGKQANRQAGKQASRQKNKQGLVSKSGRAHRPIATAFATRGCTTSRPANEGTNED